MKNPKRFYLRFIVGNPHIYTTVRTDSRSPMKRGDAVKIAKGMNSNRWRVWVEDDQNKRVYESQTEQLWNAGDSHRENRVRPTRQTV